MRTFSIVVVAIALCLSIQPAVAAEQTAEPSYPVLLTSLGLPDASAPENPANAPQNSSSGPLLKLAQGCPKTHPHFCRGVDLCCTAPSQYYCRNYQGRNPATPRGSSGCVPNTTSLEGLADYRSNCNPLVSC